MRELLILRHGKSDWDSPYEHDHDRPLSRRGTRDARTIGIFIRRLDLVPDRTLCSSAARARKTLELAMAAGGWESPWEATRDLYECSTDSAFQQIRSAGSKPRRLLLIGHNPVWEALIAFCIGGGRHRVSTAGLALLRFDAGSWEELEPGEGTLVWLVKPNLLAGLDSADL